MRGEGRGGRILGSCLVESHSNEEGGGREAGGGESPRTQVGARTREDSGTDMGEKHRGRRGGA